MPCRISAKRSPKDPPFGGARNHNRQKRMPDALAFTGGVAAVRRRLREWLCDEADRSTPAPNQINARARFAALMKLGFVAWKCFGLAWRR